MPLILLKRRCLLPILFVDNTESISAIFTLTHKAIEITNKNLSNTMRKRIRRHSRLDESADSFNVSAFLIAQFGKSDTKTSGENISGKFR